METIQMSNQKWVDTVVVKKLERKYRGDGTYLIVVNPDSDSGTAYALLSTKRRDPSIENQE